MHIERVEISGVRLLRDVAFDVTPPDSVDEGQWIVILGENGSGKTTLLRAIALAFADWNTAIYALTPIMETSTFIEGEGHGARVSVPGRAFTMLSVPGARGPMFVDVKDRPATDVFAYGSRRSATGHLVEDIRPVDALDNLFDANRGLVDAQAWLRWAALESNRYEGLYESAKRAVERLLPGGERLAMHGATVYLLPREGPEYPLSAASDGYLTTIQWTIDLIARWVHKYRETGRLRGDITKDMPCVVLVDEIDLHLHPRWQRDIISRLRSVFPRTTFIVTTHNPLTLHETRTGEVFVLSRNESGTVTLEPCDVPRGLDADRLLTGDWFGLSSTLDEETLQKIDAHRSMLRAKVPESDPERSALEAELRGRLNGYANTSAERLAQGVVAELLDEKLRARGDVTDADRERVKTAVRARLAALDAPANRAGESRAPYSPRRKRTTSKTKEKKQPARSGRR